MRFDRPGGKGEAVLGHQQVCFPGGEGQVGSADLGQLPGEPVPVQREVRVDPGRRHQAQARPRVSQHIGQLGQGLGRGQQMEIIEHQDQGRVKRGQG